LSGRADIRVVFVGDGPLLPELRSRVARAGLQQKVLFLPFQARDRLAEVQGLADISIVTLRPGHGRTSVPSKVLGYMAAARPVLAAVDADSQTAELVTASKGGLVTMPGDAAGLAVGIETIASDKARAAEMGRAGRRYLEENYSRPKAIGRYRALFERLSGEAR
jgi:colanic acid biosynthesis glycosyl transferase WcaI